MADVDDVRDDEEDLASFVKPRMTDNTSLIVRLEDVERMTPDDGIEAIAELRRLNARVAELEGACAPFKDMAGEMFARNWNRDRLVIALDNPGDPHRLTFGDFLDLHATLKGAAP